MTPKIRAGSGPAVCERLCRCTACSWRGGRRTMASSKDPDVNPKADEGALPPSSLGSGLLAQHQTPTGSETVAVDKVCPQCGTEYLTSDRFCPRDGSPLRPKGGDDPLIGRVIADR